MNQFAQTAPSAPSPLTVPVLTACNSNHRDDARDIALSRTLASHLPGLRRFARQLTRQAVDAEDLVQDCLERAVRQWDQLRTPSSVRIWLNAILYNTWISERRRLSRRGVHIALEPEIQGHGITTNQEHALMVRDLWKAIALLSLGQRDAIYKVAIEGLSYREAAEALDVPVGTVMSRLSRARVDLRDHCLASY